MAISYYTGIPRSGKTYKAVNLLYEEFVKFHKVGLFSKKKEKKKTEYVNAYTNINEFNFDIDERIKKFEFDVIYGKLQILHLMYLQKSTDEQLIEKAKELEIYGSLFVIDEAQNFFKQKKEPVLLWWLTYHAHIHHEIILITQDMSLIDTEYKAVAEHFYRAIPQKMRMSAKTFKYFSYSSHKMFKIDKIGSVSIKSDPEIFQMYVSGKNQKSFSVLHKLLIIIFILLFLVALASYYFISKFSTNEPKTKLEKYEVVSAPVTPGVNSQQNNTLKAATQNKTQDDDIANLEFFRFACYVSLCSSLDFTSKSVPLQFFLEIIKRDEIKKIEYVDMQTHLILNILAEPQIFNIFKLENQKMEKSNEKISPSSLFSR
ncbi:MAG: zonular occludens toxin domain-containing protein [Bacteroidales bacterium]|jgi:zona occludens toxin|nr:zonular occludens toxin domain-containing protein [Bacteroidales bacterium]